MKIDFFARREHFVDHLLPVWKALSKENRGTFYIHSSIARYVVTQAWEDNMAALVPEKNGSLNVYVPGDNPLLTCAYGDMVCAYKSNSERTYILMEHGVGLTFGDNAGYAGGLGMRRIADCFLAPNEYIAKKTARVLDTCQYVVGTPKLDEWKNASMVPLVESLLGLKASDPTVCISFHWDGSHVSPEAGNAFQTFGQDSILKELSVRFNMVGHCHPKAREHYRPVFERNGIPFIENFADVMAQADIYVNDASSTMYEFLVTGKPVVLMNAPHFRKEVNYGIRFWDYTDIGYQASSVDQLVKAIRSTIKEPGKFIKQRQKAVHDLYPYLGKSSLRAADCLIKFIERNETMEERLLKTANYKQLKGLLSGANNSTKGINNIEIEHLAWLGSQVPDGQCALEIGSHRGKSACCIASGIVSVPAYEKGTDYQYPKVNCIDLWQEGKGQTFDHYNSDETWEVFNKQVRMMGFNDLIVPHRISSEKAATNYRKSFREGKAQPIGLLFIDGRHYKPDVENDFLMWQEFIPTGGYIAFHDYGTRFTDVDYVIDSLLKPSGNWEDWSVIGRIFTARKK